MYTLKNKIISVQTVSGTEKRDFTRRKLKIRTHQGFIRNYNSTMVNSIGREEGMVRKNIETIVSLFRMDSEKREYFLSKTNKSPMQIQMLLKYLLTTVRAEQLQLLHPWEFPNVTIQYNAHDQELLLVGKVGINPEFLMTTHPPSMCSAQE